MKTLIIAIGLILLMLGMYKGWSIYIVAPLLTLIMLVVNGIDPVEGLLALEGSYMSELGTYLIKFYAVFYLGSIIAKLMEDSGAVNTIANYILDKLGRDKPYRVLVALFLVSFILTYGGVSLFVIVFIIVPIARPIFKQLNLSWDLVVIPVWIGISGAAASFMPGSPSIFNVIPTSYLNTTLTAGAIPGLIGSIVCIGVQLWYMRYELNKSLKSGNTYSTFVKEDTKEVQKEIEATKSSLPFWAAVTPLAVLVGIIILGSTFGNSYIKKNALYIGSLTSIIVALMLFRPHLSEVKKTLNDGAVNSVLPAFNTASCVAFGTVAANLPGFKVIENAIFSIPGHPFISMILIICIITLITGASSGSLGVVMPKYAEYYLSTGINPDFIHRVAVACSNIFTTMPHTGAVITFLSVTNLEYKNAYPKIFKTVALGSVVGTIAVLISGGFIYGF